MGPESPAFHKDGNIEFIDGDHGAVLGAFRRVEKERDKGYLIFANLDIHNSYSVKVDLSTLIKNKDTIQMEHRIHGVSYKSPVNDITIDIEPLGIRIYRIGD